MRYNGNKAEDLKIAYIGGGSRGWAWSLMSDLALEKSLSGKVYLYDIDTHAAKNNEIIGNNIGKDNPDMDNFSYVATEKIEDALTGADFVVLSILPGTFDEMESDVHHPEKYGIYQSVGDTTGPGGVIRALRTLPIYEEFARKIKECCPKAWVINYTNPMTLCMKTLYKTFPEIKAFGCCHEVFGTQELLCTALKEIEGIEGVTRDQIKTNVVGVNHFTWITKATYRDMDLFPVYRKFCEKYFEEGYVDPKEAENWLNKFFQYKERIKMDLFLRYGYIAAAGDRHLAEFSPGKWYMGSPQQVDEWGFGLTPVSWRKEMRLELLEKSEKLAKGEIKFEIKPSGEEGVAQIKALLGLCDLTTNVNIPNYGQIPNLPLGAVVETNAHFTSDSLTPLFAGEIPNDILGLTSHIVANQERVAEAVEKRDIDMAFKAFVNDSLNYLDVKTSRKMFDEMIENTKGYLKDYYNI